MRWDPLGRVLLVLAHFCTLHPPATTHLITSTHFTCVVSSLTNDTHMLCKHIFVPMQVQQQGLGYWLLVTPLHSLYFSLIFLHHFVFILIYQILQFHILVPSMLIFHYKRRMSIPLQCVQVITILQQVAMLNHNFSSFSHIPSNAPPSLAELWHWMPFQHYVFHFITTILMAQVFLPCIFIRIDMPCTFCGWICILV